MAHVLIVSVVAVYLTFQSFASVTTDSTDVRCMLFLADPTGSLLSHVRLKPAFDIAMETVDERIESGVYRNFHFNVTYFQNGRFNALGIGAEAYYRLAYDAIFGPPGSKSTIGKFGNLV